MRPEPSHVKLLILDLSGQTIQTLVDAVQDAGTHKVIVNPAELQLAPGMYLYRIEVSGTNNIYVKTDKLIFQH